MLLKERIVFLGTDVNDTIANQLTAQILYLEGRTPRRTSGSTSTRRAARSPPAWPSTTPCSSSTADVATMCMGLAASHGPVPALRRRRRASASRCPTPAS